MSSTSSLSSPSSAPSPTGRTRSAAVVNEEIRALWLRTGGKLTVEQRREYESLVTEWAQAVRGGIVEAA